MGAWRARESKREEELEDSSRTR
ncbi:hypothetical protein A2U01_0115826, partial [Trifolium medium]|nr:hypothetical protein [Trifolium medium]